MTTRLPAPKLVLNAGSGSLRHNSLHPCFSGPRWKEVRLDIDQAARPDVVGSVTDMRPMFVDATFDAIWSSHNIEHLHSHEVIHALQEFRRVLNSQGFVLITCPDLEAVARSLVESGLEYTAYEAPVGPITVHDMIFGHGASIAAGNTFMCHKTGFTRDRLGAMALKAGFTEVRVGRGNAYDLWALLLMPDSTSNATLSTIRNTNAQFLLDDEWSEPSR